VSVEIRVLPCTRSRRVYSELRLKDTCHIQMDGSPICEVASPLGVDR
jgi:hypothetical protein